MKNLILILVFWNSICFAKKPLIIVSFSVLADLVQNIVPNDFQVETLVAKDVDSHGYNPTAKDYLLLKKADHILLVGHHFEPWASKTLHKIKPHAKIYYVTAKLDLIPIQKNQSGHHHHTTSLNSWESKQSEFDPHFWHSPAIVIKMLENLSLHLQNSFPNQGKEIKNKTLDFLLNIKKRQKYYTESFLKIPDSSRKMILSHNSMQYFAQEFKVQIDSPLDSSQEGESSVKKVSELIKKIKAEKIKSLFLERSAPESLLRSIAKETGQKISGVLYSDCLSSSEEASTYLKMLDYNFSLILKSMKGVSP